VLTFTDTAANGATAPPPGSVAGAGAPPVGATGDRREVQRRLVEENLPLVHYAVAEVAHRVPRHVGRDTLVSAAMYGLAQAARAFDPSRGVPFDRYANRRIKGALLDELRGNDWAARTVRSRARELNDATDRLAARGSTAPTAADVAREMGIDEEAGHRLRDDVHRATILDLDGLLGDGGEEWLVSRSDADPADVLVHRERAAYLADAVAALPERLRTVVVGYFLEERPMQEIADELGVSESRISQLRAEALDLLHRGITSQLAPSELPAEPLPDGRAARRRAAYYESVASGSDFRTRISADRPGVDHRVTRAAGS